MMTDAEINKLSTPFERAACRRYKALQQRARESGMMNETDLLMAYEAFGTLVERNKRLGLIPIDNSESSAHTQRFTSQAKGETSMARTAKATKTKSKAKAKSKTSKKKVAAKRVKKSPA